VNVFKLDSLVIKNATVVDVKTYIQNIKYKKIKKKKKQDVHAKTHPVKKIIAIALDLAKDVLISVNAKIAIISQV
jgi:hypothetical protein